jgi:hypothetical protein
MTMDRNEERFEADLRAVLAPEPASLALRQRILAQATQESRMPDRAGAGWLSALDPRGWRLLELGTLAAAASLAIGVFAGASGLVPDSASTTTVASSSDSSTDGGTVDLVALAYDDSSVMSGDMQ